jgi:hypothetical protein
MSIALPHSFVGQPCATRSQDYEPCDVSEINFAKSNMKYAGLYADFLDPRHSIATIELYYTTFTHISSEHQRILSHLQPESLLKFAAIHRQGRWEIRHPRRMLDFEPCAENRSWIGTYRRERGRTEPASARYFHDGYRTG